MDSPAAGWRLPPPNSERRFSELIDRLWLPALDSLFLFSSNKKKHRFVLPTNEDIIPNDNEIPMETPENDEGGIAI